MPLNIVNIVYFSECGFSFISKIYSCQSGCSSLPAPPRMSEPAPPTTEDFILEAEGPVAEISLELDGSVRMNTFCGEFGKAFPTPFQQLAIAV